MEKFIIDFAIENADFFFEEYNQSVLKNDYYSNEFVWEQLRCLVTTLFLTENYNVDTKQSDDFMRKLYVAFRTNVSFEEFERFMYKYLV